GQAKRGDGADRKECGHGGPAAGPLEAAFDQAGGASADRLAGQVALQVEGQRFGAGVASVRLLGEALEADGFQVSTDAQVQARRSGRVAVKDLEDDLKRILGLERRPAGE